MLDRAVDPCHLCMQAGVKVVLDMASFEVVHAYHAQLMELLKGGLVHAVICNEVSATAHTRYSTLTAPLPPF